MTKSASFLTDDDDFDFVFVEKDFEGTTVAADDIDDDDDHNFDSYDYCEDVCSIISNRSRKEIGDDVYLYSEIIDIDIERTPQTIGLKEDSAQLTVPLGLMKDLDEAHEAAKLTQIPGLDVDGTTDHTTMTIIYSDNGDGIDDDAKETYSSVLLSVKSNETNTTAEFGISDAKNTATLSLPAKVVTGKSLSTSKNLTTTTTKTTQSYCFVTSSSQKERTNNEEEKRSNDKKNNFHKTLSIVPISKSRPSNKKRRKKLRLLKKVESVANLSSSQGNVAKKFLKNAKKQRGI